MINMLYRLGPRFHAATPQVPQLLCWYLQLIVETMTSICWKQHLLSMLYYHSYSLLIIQASITQGEPSVAEISGVRAAVLMALKIHLLMVIAADVKMEVVYINQLWSRT